VIIACCHCVVHNTTTIEEGDDIDVVTCFAAKPLKKAKAVNVAFSYNKTIEEGDRSCRRFLLLLKHKKKGKLSLPLSLQHHHKRRQRRRR
jgi:hypothetical protein